MNLNQYQNQLNKNNSGDESNRSINNAASSISQAAQEISMNSSDQQRQSQSLAQSIQATQMQITGLTNQIQTLVNQMRMDSVRQSTPMMHQTPPMPPMSQPMSQPMQQGGGGPMGAARDLGGVFSPVGGMAAGMIGGKVNQMGNQAHAGFVGMQHTNRNLQMAQAPGHLHSNAGMMSSAFDQTGLGWNPANAQNYNAGQYQRARRLGMQRGAGDLLQGAAHFGTGMMTASTGANMAAGAFGGPIGMGAGMLGIPGKIAAPLDAVNPFAFAGREMERSMAFEGGAQDSSHQFLRGRQGEQSGAWNQREQIQLGDRIRKMTLEDTSYSTEDISDLQGAMAEGDQMIGVQTIDQYEKRFKEALNVHKKGMKVLNLSNSQMIEQMETMYSIMGTDHNKMEGMVNKLYAGSHMTGLDPMQMSQVMAAGAQKAPQMGMMAETGARGALQASIIGAKAASSGMDANLLASAGGQEGLAGLMEGAQGQFLSGAGGTMMALGGAYGTDISGGISGAAGGLGSRQDMMSFAANRHSKINDLNEQDVQMQMLSQMIGLSKQMGMDGSAGEQADAMRLLAQNQFGMNSVQADAFMETLGNLPDAMEDQMRLQQESRSDQEMDEIRERRAPIQQIRRGMRRAGEEVTGGGIGRLGDMRASAGEGVSRTMRRMEDTMYGLDTRRISSEDMERASNISDDLLFHDPFSGDGTREMRDLLDSPGSNRRSIRRAASQAGNFTEGFGDSRNILQETMGRDVSDEEFGLFLREQVGQDALDRFSEESGIDGGSGHRDVRSVKDLAGNYRTQMGGGGITGRFSARRLIGDGPDDADVSESLARGSMQAFMRAVQEVVDSEGEAGGNKVAAAYKEIAEHGEAADRDIADRTLKEMGISKDGEYHKKSRLREAAEIGGMSLMGPAGLALAAGRVRKNIFGTSKSERMEGIVGDLDDFQDTQTSMGSIESVSGTLRGLGIGMTNDELTRKTESGGSVLDVRSIAERVRGMSEEELGGLKEDGSAMAQALYAFKDVEEGDDRWNDLTRALSKQDAMSAVGERRASAGDLEGMISEETDFLKLFHQTNQTNSEMVTVMQENRDVLEELRKRMDQ